MELTNLPYEIVAEIGELADWRGLVMTALTCKTLYEYITQMPWKLYCPLYVSYFTSNYKPAIQDQEHFNAMNMFVLLMQIGKITLKFKLSDIIILNGIPLIKSSNQNQPITGRETAIDHGRKHWFLDTIENKSRLDLRSCTLPPMIRKILLETYNPLIDGELIRKKEIWMYSDDTSLYRVLDNDTTDNFVRNTKVLDYTGITDVCMTNEFIHLISDHSMYTIDRSTHTEISRVSFQLSGYKFFGFDTTPMCITHMSDVFRYAKSNWTMMYGAYYDTSCDKHGIYLYSNGNRLNPNQLSISESYLKNIKKLDSIQLLMNDDPTTIVKHQSEKFGPMPDQNLYQLMDYTAGFWTDDFIEVVLQDGLTKLDLLNHWDMKVFKARKNDLRARANYWFERSIDPDTKYGSPLANRYLNLSTKPREPKLCYNGDSEHDPTYTFIEESSKFRYDKDGEIILEDIPKNT
jgi:hypothetical protein